MRAVAAAILAVSAHVLGAAFPAAADAAQLTVAALRQSGQPVDRADHVLIRVAGSQEPKRSVLALGQPIDAGTEIVVPVGLDVELITSNGNLILLRAGARFLNFSSVTVFGFDTDDTEVFDRTVEAAASYGSSGGS